MKYIKDKKIIALGVILVVFTISYFVIANKISYAFVDNNDIDFKYEKTVDVIEKCAIAYATAKKDDLFTEDVNIKYVDVQELIDKSYLVPDQDGNIKDPMKENGTLNTKRVMIKLENNEFQAKLEP